MGAFNSNMPGLTPCLALLSNVSFLLMTVQINWSRCFYFFFFCEEATNSVCSCTCCREADCSINYRNYSSSPPRKPAEGRKGRSVSTSTLSLRETSDKTAWKSWRITKCYQKTFQKNKIFKNLKISIRIFIPTI